MASINKVILVGHLGQPPETRYMPNGDAVTNVSLATSESWKDKNTGEKKDLTEWHRIVFYRKTAELAGQLMKKGSQVYIEGRLQTRKWTDKNQVERYTTEIVSDTFQMLGSKPQSANSQDDDNKGSAPPSRQQRNKQAQDFQDDGSDIPFANPYRGKIGLSV